MKDYSLIDGEILTDLVDHLCHTLGGEVRGLYQFSKLIKMTAKDRLDEKEKAWLDLMEDNGESAQNMLKSLSLYSSFFSKVYKPVDFKIDRLVRDSVSEVGTDVLSLNIEDGCTISSRYEFWNLMLKELVSNATQYHPKEKKHIKKITISFYANKEEYLLCVEDNGIGVNESMYDFIYKPFKRLQSRNDYYGVGMGLAFCYRIAKIQGGSLSFSQSDLGGLCVTYREPIAVDGHYV